MIKPNAALLQTLVEQLKGETRDLARERVCLLSEVEMVGLMRVDLNGYSYNFCQTAIPLIQLVQNVFLNRKMVEVSDAQNN